ncbi:hypothetical protein PCAR4_880010 [Paraburkholderia caribensis]|nr:hypothetical protein PCAR4_880010 [Paraburkholderia caribensis]
MMNFVSLFQGTMQVGSLDGPETIEACAKAPLAQSASAALAAARSTWIPESMLPPFCSTGHTGCLRTCVVVDGRHGVREARNLAEMLWRDWIGLAEGAFQRHLPEAKRRACVYAFPSDSTNIPIHAR